MKRAPVGLRLRKRRQELQLSQTALARRIGISPSYLNLIEHNKRAIGGTLLHRFAAALELDSRDLAGTEEARLIAELTEICADQAVAGLAAAEVHDIVAASPSTARAILSLYRAYEAARTRSDLIGERLGEDSFLAEASRQVLSLITTIRSYSEILKDYGDLTEAERGRFLSTLVEESERLTVRATDMFDFLGGHGSGRPRPSPREEIEDFISDHANHFPRIEAAAERLNRALAAETGASHAALSAHLAERHGIRVVTRPAETLPADGELLDPDGTFLLADTLAIGSARFRIARLVGRRECAELIDEIVGGAGLSSPEAPPRLRRALAAYFAAAVMMPYAPFRQAADELRHDLTRLGRRFGASFEQVAQRLTTLRRPGQEGVPLHFLRTDVAGNISKRFSASGLRLPRYGGACPRWAIHHAFLSPGRIVTQAVQLPDGERYLFIARAAVPDETHADRQKLHSVMIGADMAHAGRFVYADGLDLSASEHVTPVGVTCRQCPIGDCRQRAFDRIPEATSAIEPASLPS